MLAKHGRRTGILQKCVLETDYKRNTDFLGENEVESMDQKRS
jgi:hypothetical protein